MPSMDSGMQRLGDFAASLLRTASLFVQKLARSGAKPDQVRAVELFATYTVGQMMTAEVTTIPMSLPLFRLFEMACCHDSKVKHQGYPVVDDAGLLAGMVTRSDLPAIDLRDNLGWLVAADVMSSRPPVVAYPEESLRDAAERMLEAGIGRLPVVSSATSGRIVGILSRSDLLKGLTRHQSRRNAVSDSSS